MPHRRIPIGEIIGVNAANKNLIGGRSERVDVKHYNADIERYGDRQYGTGLWILLFTRDGRPTPFAADQGDVRVFARVHTPLDKLSYVLKLTDRDNATITANSADGAAWSFDESARTFAVHFVPLQVSMSLEDDTFMEPLFIEDSDMRVSPWDPADASDARHHSRAA